MVQELRGHHPLNVKESVMSNIAQSRGKKRECYGTKENEMLGQQNRIALMHSAWGVFRGSSRSIHSTSSAEKNPRRNYQDLTVNERQGNIQGDRHPR